MSAARTADGPIVAVIGAGVVGKVVGRYLRESGHRIAWHDRDRRVAESAAARLGGVVLDSLADTTVVDGLVLATPGPHRSAIDELLRPGANIVSLVDEPDEVAELLAIPIPDDARLVVGAVLSPGLSGLLARHLSTLLDEVDEIHVAVHGTGGPSCARRHHDALGSRAQGWFDGGWIERPGGSGRELCWFPDPIGAIDCYRAGLADPLVLHTIFPSAERISARVSATRRDRLTARLPMLRPPHVGGNVGAVRVEVRGWRDGERVTHVAGAAGRVEQLTGAVAAASMAGCLDGMLAPGRHLPGDDLGTTEALLGDIVRFGVALHEFTGVARATTW